MGHVDEVNGPGALAVPTFVPSRHELIVLLKHWSKVVLDIRYEWFIFEQVGSAEMRLEPFANRGVNRIADALNDEDLVRKTLDEVHEGFARSQDPLAWRVFTHQASPQEEQRFREKFLRGDDSEPKPPAPSTKATTDEGAC